MPMPNSMNTAKGRDFQQGACAILREHFRCGNFKLDCPVFIGNPPKEHKFDLVCEDGRYVGECKNYSWTETGNVPSAKLAFLNEAVFYLLHLPGDVQRFVALRRDVHPRRQESLAEFYVRTYYHLLDGVKVIEIDLNSSIARVIGEGGQAEASRSAKRLAQLGGSEPQLRPIQRIRRANRR